MMYPLNIFSTDPTGGSIRPFIIFIAHEYKADVMKATSWSNALPTMVPVGGFALPFPDGGLEDSVTHTYNDANPMMSKAVSAFSGEMGDLGGMTTGTTIDPLVTQIYKGSTPRSWSGSWEIIPKSMAESAAVALIIKQIKISGSPDKYTVAGKAGMLIQPHVFKIVFSNPLIHLAMSFDKMAFKSYSINYFAQGFATTYKDMMPKHINIKLEFVEFGIKYRSDWM